MKAVVYDKAAKTNRLSFREVNKPVATDDQVLIKVIAVAVNAADSRSMKMGIIPKIRIFGVDISGQVVAVGKNVNLFKIGDEVLGELSAFGFGGFAEYVAAPEKAIVHKPFNLPFDFAASLPISAITALLSLKPNGRCIIIGGSLTQIFGSLLLGWLMSLGSKKVYPLAAKTNQKDLEYVAKLTSEKKITLVIDCYYTLDKVADAVGYLSGGHASGKLIVKLS